VTSKINPNDVDIVLFFEVTDYINLVHQWGNIRNVTDIDAYCAAAVNTDSQDKLSPEEFNTITNNRNYWKGQFGYDRIDRPKGIIVLKPDKIMEYLNGGESYVNGCI